MPKSTAVFPANLGLFLGRPPLAIPARGLKDGLNFRIKDGKISALNMGWTTFGLFNPLSGPVTLIENFFLRTGGQILIFGTTKDLYQYNEGTQKVAFITPIYAAGTANPTNGSAVVIGGTAWDTNLKVGDEMFFGSATETDPDATGNGGWYTILTVDSAVQVTLTANYTGTGGAQAYTGRKLYTGDIFDYWRTATFFDAQPGDEDLWFATNGVDDIATWNGIDAQIIPSAVTFTCKELAVFKNMMLYGNIIEDSGELKPTSIKNSDAANPEDMAAGIAGEFVVNDSVDPIVSMFNLGDNMMIYGQRSAIMTQFVGDPLNFIFRTAIAGVGPLTGRVVADFGDFHEFVGADTQFIFDGVSLKEAGAHVWRDILRTKAPNRLDLAFSHFDEEQGELIWAFPLTTDANLSTENTIRTAFAEHYLEDVEPEEDTPYSKRDFPFTSSGFFERQTTLTWTTITGNWDAQDFRWNDQFFSAAFPFSLVGAEDGKVYTLSTSSNQADGSALTSFVRFGRIAISDGRFRNLVTRLYPFAPQFAAAGYTLDVTLHLSDTPSGPTTSSTMLGFDLTLAAGSNHFVSPFRRGRYMEVEFGTAGPSEPWEVEGYDRDIRPGGKR
jgi:hypothetical protein